MNNLIDKTRNKTANKECGRQRKDNQINKKITKIFLIQTTYRINQNKKSKIFISYHTVK